MKSHLVTTIVGPDRTGLVESVARVVAAHGGNWLESRMCRLGGDFAGILRIEIPADKKSPLLDALKKDPSQIPVQTKLLEVYAARKSLPQFNTLAAELRARTSGRGADWDKVVAMGSQLDPANPLYKIAAVEAKPSLNETIPVPTPAESFADKASRTKTSGARRIKVFSTGAKP